MTTVLLSARTYDEWAEGASYALVELSPEDVDRLLARIDGARWIRQVDKALLSLEFWSYDVEWVAYSDELEEILGDARDGGFVILDERPEIPPESLVECDCNTVVAYTDQVFWKAFVKHTGAQVESAPMTEKALRGGVVIQSKKSGARKITDLSREAQREFNVGAGRYLSASLCLLYSAIWTMPENEFRGELIRIYDEYYSVVAALGRLVPPMSCERRDELCRVAIGMSRSQ